MTNRKQIFVLLAVGVCIIISFIYVKNTLLEAGEIHSSDAPAFEAGRLLSIEHCSSCHLYPEAGLLPKKIWTSSVLPAMGPRLGIFRHRFNTYPTETSPNLPENYYPANPLVTQAEWKKILDYYQDAAPEALTPHIKEKDIVVDNFSFTARTSTYRSPALKAPMVTSIRFDTQNRLIYAADANLKRLLIFDSNVELLHSIPAPSPVSDIRFSQETTRSESKELLITLMGHLLPTDIRSGSVKKIVLDSVTHEYRSSSVLSDNLARPVESKRADLNQDGLKDLLISEFGHRTGELFWTENTGSQFSSARHILVDSPGCIETSITDFNGNDLNDIIALCTQADQAIYLFTNQGNGKFLKQTLLRFQAVAGSSSFSLHDFNKDGHLDILYTSGDNADYSRVLKPYHGVYIYLNDGENNFTKAWFYPINGAYDAQALDFNRDGLLDIATIAFYADFESNPQEGFVYFKNEGGLNFTPYTHPQASVGRWITMDIADWTDDGYEDIVLGNFSQDLFGVKDSLHTQWEKGPHFLLLENSHGDQGN